MSRCVIYIWYAVDTHEETTVFARAVPTHVKEQKNVSQEEFLHACAKFYKKILFSQEPKSINGKLKLPRLRSTAKLGLKVYTKKEEIQKYVH